MATGEIIFAALPFVVLFGALAFGSWRAFLETTGALIGIVLCIVFFPLYLIDALLDDR